MTRSFADIVPAVARLLSGPDDVQLTLHRKNGEVKTHRKLDNLSRHRELALMPLLADIETAMNDLPILRDVNGDWVFSVKFDLPPHRRTRMATFRIMILDFNISRAAAPSAKITAEMMTEVEERLSRVERDTSPENGDIRRWLVSCKDRETTTLLARSPRQAAWTYAALCNRSRKEIRAWRETPEKIHQIYQIHPKDEWRAPTS